MRKLNKYQKLIKKFLKDPDAIYKNVGLIKREVSIAKKLFVKIEQEMFWTECHLPFKLNSLAWLLSEDGVEHLNLEIKRQKLKPHEPIKYDINDEKHGEDGEVERRKRTIMDFLKDGS